LIEAEVKPGEWHYAVGLELTADLFMGHMQFEEEGTIAHGGKVYLYGETATDSQEPFGFGVIPLEWRPLRAKEVKCIPTPRLP